LLLRALPNVLTLGRLALGLVFPWIPVPWRPGVVAAAALSDLADGAISRSAGVSGTAGQILDPIADKVFVLAVVVTLLFEGDVRLYEVALIGLRDWVVLAGAAWVLLREDWHTLRHLPPTFLGKVTTTLQFVLLLSLLIAGRMPHFIFVPTVLLSALAALDYCRVFWRMGAGQPGTPAAERAPAAGTLGPDR
jgi:phosphatidylglycerophosphate synthase